MARFDPKRLTDILLAAAGLVVLAPVMAAVAAAVAVALGRPVLFRQVRPGLHGKPFRLVKFRTMLDAVGDDGKPLDDAERLTRFGRFLRASSLDELPELWNILKGDMSLVGPRPLLMHYLPLYTPEQARRHDVRPGLTGWSQVNGRNALSWPEKLALDTWYVDHRSFRLDLRIILMTLARVVSRSGIAAEGSETMPEFRGDEEGL
ncbi:MAG TPA: sugar transferase [Allosphingosinicella sp.]|nr:sugar transferase [Allosphingosinicella sp.]